MLVSALLESEDGVTTTSGARDGAVVLTVCFLLVVVFKSVQIRELKMLRWFGPMVTIAFVVISGALFAAQNLNAAWAMYGGLQVPRAGRIFSDSHIVLTWFSCGLCQEWDPLYGPGLTWFAYLTSNGIGVSWLPVIGLLLTAFAVLSLVVLGRRSSGIGLWVLAIGSLSPAWLLLVDRANGDLIIIASLVAAAALVAVKPSLVGWGSFALALWFLGTLKLYPFAMGVVLLMALAIRWGWVIIGAYATAVAAFTVLSRDALFASTSAHSSLSVLGVTLGESPIYGRVVIAELLRGLGSAPLAALLAAIFLAALLASSLWWGWNATPIRVGQAQLIFAGTLALGGASAFAAKVLVGGFGFFYSGAFLLMIVPSLIVKGKGAEIRNGPLMTLAALMLVALFAGSNSALATIAGTLVAGFGFGIGFRMVRELVYRRRHAILVQTREEESLA